MIFDLIHGVGVDVILALFALMLANIFCAFLALSVIRQLNKFFVFAEPETIERWDKNIADIFFEAFLPIAFFAFLIVVEAFFLE